MSLLTWNALFGDVGGLLLCLHKSLTLHPELISVSRTELPLKCIGDSTEAKCLSNEKSCVDIELEAANLPQARIDEVQTPPVAHPVFQVTPEVVGQDFTLKAIAHVVQPQAPPGLADTSILIAQTVNLRL